MELIFILIIFLSVVFFLYTGAILTTMWIKNCSQEKAKGVVNKFLEGIFFQKKPEPSWTADAGLVNSLLEAQAPYNLLDKEYTAFWVGLFKAYNIPEVTIQLVPKSGISYDALKIVLKDVVRNYLTYFGQTSIFVDVFFEQAGEESITLHIIYAVTAAQKEEFRKLYLAVKNRKEQKIRQVQKKLKDEILEKDLLNGTISTADNANGQMQVGYDTKTRTPIYIDILATGMLAVVGGTGSGKSVAVLYMLYHLKKSYQAEIYLADFKRSGMYMGIAMEYAEFGDTVALIDRFYAVFEETAENNEKIKVLLIDEYAGFIVWLMQNDKKKAEEIKGKISNILMMGRSRKCFVWCIQQRMTAALFPSGIGAIDNFQVCIGLGRLSPDSRKSLFAGEHMEDTEFEDKYSPGQSQGLILVDGKPLRAIQFPHISEVTALQKLLRQDGK